MYFRNVFLSTFACTASTSKIPYILINISAHIMCCVLCLYFGIKIALSSWSDAAAHQGQGVGSEMPANTGDAGAEMGGKKHVEVINISLKWRPKSSPNRRKIEVASLMRFWCATERQNDLSGLRATKVKRKLAIGLFTALTGPVPAPGWHRWAQAMVPSSPASGKVRVLVVEIGDKRLESWWAVCR